MLRPLIVLLAGATAALVAARTDAGIYQFGGPFANPHVGPAVLQPQVVRGKEISFAGDRNAITGTAAPGQVNAWDGQGGLANGLVLHPTGNSMAQVDALAMYYDSLQPELQSDEAHLLFAVDAAARSATGAARNVPLTGTITTTGGLTIGGAGSINYEAAAAYYAPRTMGVWATASNVSGMLPVAPVDGLELYGNEPTVAANAVAAGDSNKFSITNDSSAGGPTPYAIWNYQPLTGTASGYLPHSVMVSAVRSILGIPDLNGPLANAFDLDALMVQEDMAGGVLRQWDGNDQVIFSIRQLVNPAGGFYATGSEIFVLSANGSIGFLNHGGHVWDKAFAEQYLQVVLAGETVQLDVSALEAVGAPEPGTIVLAALGLLGSVGIRRRLGRR